MLYNIKSYIITIIYITTHIYNNSLILLQKTQNVYTNNLSYEEIRTCAHVTPRTQNASKNPEIGPLHNDAMLAISDKIRTVTPLLKE